MDRFGRALSLGCAAALLATGAWAQQAQQGSGTVAQLKEITGNVLVSRTDGLAAASDSHPLANGMFVITTANSEALVVFDNGCRVRLKENQRFEVDSRRVCAALLAQALPAVPAAGTPLAVYVFPGLVGIGIITGGGGGGGPATPVSPN